MVFAIRAILYFLNKKFKLRELNSILVWTVLPRMMIIIIVKFYSLIKSDNLLLGNFVSASTHLVLAVLSLLYTGRGVNKKKDDSGKIYSLLLRLISFKYIFLMYIKGQSRIFSSWLTKSYGPKIDLIVDLLAYSILSLYYGASIERSRSAFFDLTINVLSVIAIHVLNTNTFSPKPPNNFLITWLLLSLTVWFMRSGIINFRPRENTWKYLVWISSRLFFGLLGWLII
jgi:hypothetical protein